MSHWNADEVIADLATLQDFVRYGASRFNAAGLHFGHGTDNAVDEALHLVTYALSLPVSVPPEFLSARLAASEKRAILSLFARRIDERRPAAYLTNKAYFAGQEFFVDDRVLVPRSPIAELIENRFEPWSDPYSVAHVLDLCTGSGCIAIGCALAFPDALVVATDISADALDVARINVERFQLNDAVTLIQSDLFDAVPAQRFDIIVSNPPYVGDEEIASLPAEYRHEPDLGLRSEQEGLAHAVRILRQARSYLSDHGILVVEVGNSQLALEQRFPTVPFTWLEFARGGDGVFLLRAEELDEFAREFET